MIASFGVSLYLIVCEPSSLVRFDADDDGSTSVDDASVDDDVKRKDGLQGGKDAGDPDEAACTDLKGGGDGGGQDVDHDSLEEKKNDQKEKAGKDENDDRAERTDDEASSSHSSTTEFGGGVDLGGESSQG